MKTHFPFGRLLAALLLAGVISAYAQSLNPAFSITPDRQAVTEGRSVTFEAGGGGSSIQWQLTPDGGLTTRLLDDGGVYAGTKTKTLEVKDVTWDMNNYHFRFLSTANGVTQASNWAQLIVSPVVFPMPTGIACDGVSKLVISDSANHTLHRAQVVDTSTKLFGLPMHLEVTARIGSPGQTGAADGTASVARFNRPQGVALEATGRVTVADSANGTIREISAAEVVSTLAGSSESRGSADGVGVAARFSNPIGIARAADDTVFVADSANHVIRKITPGGTVSTFAGSPGNAGSADGVGSQARFNNPTGVAIDGNGVLYVTDTTNNTLRRIAADGTVTTVAGIPGIAGSQSGAASQTTFNGPTGVAVSQGGNMVFIADTGNSIVRLYLPSFREVRPFAGVPTVGGMSDGYDGLLNQPTAIAVDGSNDYYTINVFIADTGNAAIRLASWDYGLLTLPLIDLSRQSAPASAPGSGSSSGGGTTAGSGSSAGAGGASSGGGTFAGAWVAALAGAALLRLTLGCLGRERPPA